MTDSVLFQAFVYLCAAVVCVPISKRIGLGAVLGYLIAGVLIGPWVLGLVGSHGEHVMHFSEFGVVMMLFVVGLELRPSLLWELRRPILGLGGAQVVVTTLVIGGGALAFGVSWKPALAIGMIAAMSSTAIVLSSLAERELLRTQGGQAGFSVLLFQDISVIPILAVFPMLGAAAAGGDDAGGGRPAWLQGLFILGAVAAVVLAGRFVVRPAFQFLARVKLRESFTAAALLLVVGIAFLMMQVGLSPALGTFLAGVVLADSEYRHEMEADIEPFKGLLLGLFFISIGAEIDFGLIGGDPLIIAGIVIGIMAAKLAILRSLGRLFGLDRPSRWTLAFSLAQIGEFAFVLLTMGVDQKIFDEHTKGLLVAAVAISMVLTPLLFISLERWVLPKVSLRLAERPQDEITTKDAPVVIAGYGRFGQTVGRILRANRIKITILDLDPDMVDMLARLGIKVHYGDASRMDLLHAAGCEHASLFVLAVDDVEESTKIAEQVRRHFPHLPILARCRNRPHYYELRKLGIQKIYRETFGSAYETGIGALMSLGYRAHTAHRLAQRWRRHEERQLEEMTDLWNNADDDTYFERARRGLDEAERLMKVVDPTVRDEADPGRDNESLRADPRPDEAAAR
jgi:monovalent cation:proton antiporter-2 (CPA2) family protein